MRTFVIAALLALFCFTTLSFGQAQDSILVGTVIDSSGSAVPGATVVATNKNTGVKYTSVANTVGEYRLNNVPVGQYDVSATAKGFATATVANVDLQLNHTASVNLTLPVGTVSTTVDVTEAAATIDTSTAQLQTTFDARSAVDVPPPGSPKSLTERASTTSACSARRGYLRRHWSGHRSSASPASARRTTPSTSTASRTTRTTPPVR